MHDTGCLGLVHWDDPEGWNGEGGGRRVQDGQTTPTRLYAGGELQGSPVWQALAGHKRSFPLVQLLSRVRLFATPWTAAHKASL